MVHKMRLDRLPFDKIESGEKIYELRLFDEKRQTLNVGDTIEFTVTDGTGDTLVRKVKALHRYESFDELYASLPLTKCGYSEENAEGASPADMEGYYSKEQQKRYGVLAIELDAQ